MNFFVDKIQKFFESIARYFSNSGYTFSWLFIIFMGVFALTTIIIITSSIFSYEFMLIRAIEKINKFLTKNPRINDDNLIPFNNKMKEKGIPKILRRQWQQFMLYREHEASYYMSFQHCVENPLKNSTYRQQIQIYRVFSYVLSFLAILIGIFCSHHTNFVEVLQDVLIIPVFIIVLYSIISMILNIVHNATTGDLYQNYQYFEINIDKATLTLPEYVDYEVLFTQDEIKHGIPVLFEYIQKRAIEEQKELERARIKNVEHEKFNFEKSGLDASLVLERSMQEAENYIATRKKFLQDIEQVNNEIAAIENQYKENVKENQRLMQTSKETVDGLKKQLEQATSSIEINYIKKQMKDEIDRQQIAERDFDALTDKHNKEVKSLQGEVERLQGEIESAKKNLESNMMSEFGTYSTKIYNKVEEAVQANEKTVIDDYKKQINDLEEKLALKDEELDNVYTQYQAQLSNLEEKSKQFDSILKEKDDMISQAQDQLEMSKSKKSKKVKQFNDVEDISQPEESYAMAEDNSYEYSQPLQEGYDSKNYTDNTLQDSVNDYNDVTMQENEYNNVAEEVMPEFNYDNRLDDNHLVEESEEFNYTDASYEPENNYTDQEQSFNYLDNETTNKIAYDYLNENKEDQSFNYLDSEEDNSDEGNLIKPEFETFNYLDSNTEEAVAEKDNGDLKFDYLSNENDEEKDVDSVKAAQEEKQANEEDDNLDIDSLFNSWLEDDSDDEDSAILAEDDKSEDEIEDKSNKDLNNEATEDKTTDDEGIEDKNSELDEDIADIDNSVEDELEEDEIEEDVIEDEEFEDEEFEDEDADFDEEPKAVPVRRVGRPRKVVDETEVKSKRKVGRPRKIVEEEPVKRKAGRPRKEVVEVEEPKRRVGRPRKEKVNETPVRRVGRPRKDQDETPVKRSVGRPKKANPVGRPKAKRSVGRPRKSEEKETRRVGRPRKETNTPVRSVGRPKKANPVGRPKKKNPVGRPKKASKESPRQTKISEIDKQLNALNKQIARESNNIAKTQKQLANVKLKKTK